MKSALSRLLGQTKPPVPIGKSRSNIGGHSLNLSAGQGDRETLMRQYGRNGTIYSIISLLAESTATPNWRLYRSQPVDGRRRYTTGDMGSDQRTEIITHAAIKLWNNPNPYMTGFEFREAAQQHQELTGETYWVLDIQAGIPISMWIVRPDRMEPLIGHSGELLGWIYTAADGNQTPLKLSEVICEKRPDPLDPHRGLGPIQSIMPNIQQQVYATEYQRNVFINGAVPGGVISIPNNLNQVQFDELIDRWRETHRGVARAGHVGVLEAGATWTPAGTTNRDMDYANLRINNRDEMREAWRVHKHMLGTSDDVNRANAETAEEVFVAWQIIPRLNRRRDTLNNKLLPLFGTTGQGVEFDYNDPSPSNAEAAAAELEHKSNSALLLVQAGYDPADVLEVVGLPDMGVANTLPSAPPPVVNTITNKKDPQAQVFQQLAKDFPPAAVAWVHHATWSGPVKVPLGHINPALGGMEGADPDHVNDFVQALQDGKKLNPVILVKTPNKNKLKLVDGHHRYLAYAQLGLPVAAYIGVVNTDSGPWDTMHDTQYTGDTQNTLDASGLAAVMQHNFTARAIGTSMNRSPR